LSNPLATLQFKANQLSVQVGQLVTFTGTNIVITPEQDPVATLQDADVEIPGLNNLVGAVTVHANDIVLSRHGITIGTFTVTVAGPIGDSDGLFQVRGIVVGTSRLAVDFSGVNPVQFGTVSVSVASAKLLNGAVQLTSDPQHPNTPALKGTINSDSTVW